MSNSLCVHHKTFGRAKAPITKEGTSLPRAAALIPRDSIFSCSTRSPCGNNILWPVIYVSGGNGDRASPQVWVFNCCYPRWKEFVLYRARGHLRTVEFPFPPLPRKRLKRERTGMNAVNNSLGDRLLRCTWLLTVTPVWTCKDVRFKFLQAKPRLSIFFH